MDNEKALIIEFNDAEYKFIIYNKNKNLLGSFTINQLIKYVGSKTDLTFLQAIDMGNSNIIIESYVCKYDTTNKLILVNHIQSPFMGNIEMLMKLYNGVHKFIEGNITTIGENIINKLKEFEYMILVDALKLISTISDVIKNDATKQTIKEHLAKYNVFITYKISVYTKEIIEKQQKTTDKIQNEITQLFSIKTDIDKKIENLLIKMQEQHSQIATILNTVSGTVPLIKSKFNEKLISLDESENAISAINSSPALNAENDLAGGNKIIKDNFINEKNKENKNILSFSDSDSACQYSDTGNIQKEIAYLTPTAKK